MPNAPIDRWHRITWTRVSATRHRGGLRLGYCFANLHPIWTDLFSIIVNLNHRLSNDALRTVLFLTHDLMSKSMRSKSMRQWATTAVCVCVCVCALSLAYSVCVCVCEGSLTSSWVLSADQALTFRDKWKVPWHAAVTRHNTEREIERGEGAQGPGSGLIIVAPALVFMSSVYRSHIDQGIFKAAQTHFVSRLFLARVNKQRALQHLMSTIDYRLCSSVAPFHGRNPPPTDMVWMFTNKWYF